MPESMQSQMNKMMKHVAKSTSVSEQKRISGVMHKKAKKSHGKAKVGVVMHEFKKGKLKSGSGQKVTDSKQAVAIALSEAGLSKNKRKK